MVPIQHIPVPVTLSSVTPIAAGKSGPAFSNAASSSRSFSSLAFVRLWEVEVGKPLGIFEGHAYPIRSLTFSPDSDILASTSDDTTALLWSLSRLGDEVGRLARLRVDGTTTLSQCRRRGCPPYRGATA